MIHLAIEQGSPTWERVRLGRPTGSGFDNLLTPKTLKPSASSAKYRGQLLAEWMVGYAIDFGGGAFIDRGRDMEQEARDWYAFQQDIEVLPGGFCLTDDLTAGCSPDGLIGIDGGLELKCPALHTHIAYLLDPEQLVADYRGQVQGSLSISGRAWWDLVSYSPMLPPVRVRVEPEAAYQEAFRPGLAAFVADLEEAKAKLAPHRDPDVGKLLDGELKAALEAVTARAA